MDTAHTPEPVRCRDACGAVVADEPEAGRAGWQFLEIQKRWRCPQCMRELLQVNEGSEA